MTIAAQPRASGTPVRSKDFLDCEKLGSSEIWQRWRDHFSHPPLFNDLGCFRTGTDVMGIHNFMFPPFSGMGEGTGFLYINRKRAASYDVPVGYTWFPDHVRRRTSFDQYDIETITRAATRDPAALIHLRVTNKASATRTPEIGIKVAGRLIHTIDGWASIGPAITIEEERPENWNYDAAHGVMHFASSERAFQAQGTRPAPDRVDGKTFVYMPKLSAGESWTLHFVAALDEAAGGALARWQRLAYDFESANRESTKAWNEKIRAAFEPGNKIFSGHLPTLTANDAELVRLYVMTTVGCLCLRRDNPLSVCGPVYVTLSPNYWTTASFIWDMMIAGPFYALLDPALLRKHIEVWLRADLTKCLATDYVTGKSLGYWYAVNSPGIVRLAHDYLRYSGDISWLDTDVDGRPVIEHLQAHALKWHDYDQHGHGLADCGSVLNLLECVSTYTHEVAAFNAMWVAALRQVACMRRLRGEDDIADKLENDARALLKQVLGLYAEGRGTWRCRQPDSSFHDVNHIYDFVAVLESICGDLPEHVRREMFDRFQREHQTENWTRSLSEYDDDAHRSLRVDHQWTGSYASISAQAINGLYRMGYGAEAFDWLARITRVVRQGPIGQGHWVSSLFPSFEGGPWKCSYTSQFMCDWVVSANGAYPAMIIESVFGVDAQLCGGLRHRGTSPGLGRGARLDALQIQKSNYSVDMTGIHPVKEEK